MTYDQIAWLPLTAGLTLAGLIVSFFVWRRRGTAAGLRGVAWSLLPLAAYLIGAIQLLWTFGTAIAHFASSFVFSQRVWAGIIVLGVAIVLFVVSGSLRGRALRRATARGHLWRARNRARRSAPARARPAGWMTTCSGTRPRCCGGTGFADGSPAHVGAG